MVETSYNTMGEQGRTCPCCYRPGTLIGSAKPGATISCTGCWAGFELVELGTLRTLTAAEMGEVRGGAPSARCQDCGEIGPGHTGRCSRCERGLQADLRGVFR